MMVSDKPDEELEHKYGMLERELSRDINALGLDKRLNTKDIFIAEYLVNCLRTYAALVKKEMLEG